MVDKTNTMKAIESLRPTTKTLESLRPAIDTLFATLALRALLPRMQALARRATARRRRRTFIIGAGNGAVARVVTIAGVLATLGAAATLYSMKRRRRDEADEVRARVSDALLGEPTLAGLPIRATVHVPLWWRSPITLEVTGPVPTAEVRDAVLQRLTRELSQTQAGARIENRIVIDPADFEHERLVVAPG
jgi:hypothetical protein